jgi:ACT domain-containing protein
MPRRFLTSEDVRAAKSREIVVDAETLVTPQALESARAAGIEIRTASGSAYVEPAPDRGPDAARAKAALSSLPEPEPDLGGATGVVIAVVGKNRPGILMEVTGVLGGAGASVLDISQSVMGEYFQLTLSVGLPSSQGFGDLKTKLQCLGGPDDYVVRVMHERVFRFMHRV